MLGSIGRTVTLQEVSLGFEYRRIVLLHKALF